MSKFLNEIRHTTSGGVGAGVGREKEEKRQSYLSLILKFFKT